MAHENVWPEYLMIRDTGLHDDLGGGGQRIYTTAGRGYEKRKYVRDDLAALSLPVSNTGGWQPIETAPKDGSWVIGYQPHKEVQDTVQLWAWKAFDCRDNIWVNAIDANDCDDQPTHWQPLPEAPL